MKLKFVRMRFELPHSAPLHREKETSKQNEDGNWDIIINLDSEIATDFFGKSFVEKYKEFRRTELNK